MKFNVEIENLANELDFEVDDVKMLIMNFLQVVTNDLLELSRAIESEDFEEIAHNAHSIKGSSANLRLKEVSLIAKEIELNAQDKKRDFDYKGAYVKLKNKIDGVADV